MLHFIFGRTGTGKTQKVNTLLKSMVDDGFDNLILLVPEQSSFESERAMLRLLTPANSSKVEVLSFTRLSDRFFSQYGGRNKNSIDPTGRVAIMELVLKSLKSELVLFRKQVKIPQFVSALLSLSEQLKRSVASPSDLMRAVSNQSGLYKSKATELSMILAEYDRRLNEQFGDPLDDLTIMAERLNEHRYFESKTVVIDSFKGFTAQQLLILDKIISQAKEVYITLGCDGVSNNENNISLLSNVNSTASTILNMAKQNNVKIAPAEHLDINYRFKNNALTHLEKNIFAPDYIVFDEKAEEITICKAKTVYDEADFVARTIRRLVRTQDMRYRDFVVIARETMRYSGIIDAAFKRYDIPCFMDFRNSVETKSIFKFVASAMQAVISNFNSDDIFALLKTYLTDITVEDIAIIDNYVTIWRINGGDWLEEWECNPDGMVEGFNDTQKEALNHLNALRQKIINPLIKLKYGFNSSSVKDISKALYKFVIDIKADKNLVSLSNALESKGDIQLADEERRSYDLFIGLLDQIVLVLKNTEIDITKYYDMFMMSVSLSDIGSLPQGLDEVTIGSAERMRPAAPKVTFVIGANNGVFPAPLLTGGLFTDAELKKLKESGIELPDNGEKQAVEENYLAYTALCSPSERLYITYAGADFSGNSLEPSDFVTLIRDIFPSCNDINEWCDKQDSFNMVSIVEGKMAAISMFAREYKKKNELAMSLAEYFEKNKTPEYLALKSLKIDREMSLSPQTANDLFGVNITTSASKIDVYHKCKFSYFCKYGIKAMPLRVAQLDVLERGTLIHYVLENIINDKVLTNVAALNDEQLSEKIKMLVDEFFKAVMGDKRDISAKEIYVVDRLIVLLTELVRHIAEDFMQSKFFPAAVELEIGDSENGIESMKIMLPDGGSVELIGKVDRVDTYKSNGNTYVRIVDYKTGSRSMDLSDVLYGQNLQMLVYLMAIQRTGKQKFGENIVPSGILYMPSKRASSKLTRTADDDEIKLDLSKALKMKGIILNEPEVISAMETTGTGLFTPLKLKKDGTPDTRSPIYTMEQYGLITKRIEKLLKEMGQSLHSGDISVDPIDGVDLSACKYCDYRSACGRDADKENKKIKKLKMNEAFAVLERGDEDGILSD